MSKARKGQDGESYLTPKQRARIETYADQHDDNDHLGSGKAYFHHDNAYFRRRGDSGNMGVEDVLSDGKWVPYEGDAIKPVLFGDVVDEAALPL